jgi:hypothetical protein
MKIKLISVFIIFLLLFTCFNIIAFEQKNNDFYFKTLFCNDNFVFSKALFEKTDDCVKLKLNEATTYIMDPGLPILPVVVKKYVFPRNSKITKIECNFSGFSEEYISGKIFPAPQKLPLIDLNKNMDQNITIIFNDSVYDNTELYPSENYDYSITCGMYGLTLSVRMYPIRYSPLEDKILTYDFADINIIYEKPTFTTVYEEEYDMVIIAPKKFSSELRPLINHKNNFGIHTFLKTTEEIYAEYTGRDKPEQIKYFIKDAIETYNISFVLLVGGMKGIRKQWYIPVRRTNVDVYWETGTISELYYADIYRYNESSASIEFEDWDSNGNDVFAEWFSFKPEDVIDGDPDVAIGRFACRNSKEVKTVVEKTIDYETKSYNSASSKKMLVAGGDTFPNSLSYYEGEMTTDASSDLMKNIGYSITKLYASDGSFSGPFDILRELKQGVGIVLFEGHGNPAEYVTHPPHDDTWIYGLTVFNMDLINNRDPLPIVVIDACHSSQFNVTPLNFLIGILPKNIRNYFNPNEARPGGFWRFEFIRECWSWKLLSLKNKGAVATIGNSGLGYGNVNEYALVDVSQWLVVRFFDAIANQGMQTLGEAHARSIADYVNIFDAHNYGITDRKTIDGWTLLGDPSLKIGGYEIKIKSYD